MDYDLIELLEKEEHARLMNMEKCKSTFEKLSKGPTSGDDTISTADIYILRKAARDFLKYAIIQNLKEEL